MGADSFQLQPMYMKGSGGTVDCADFDNDGWLDILVTGYDSTSSSTFTELHHNNMNGTFSVVPTNLPDFGEPSGTAIADYDLDGSPDACFIGGTSVFPSVGSALALHTGLNAFNVQPFFHSNIINPILSTADIDNDGDYDLVFSNYIIRNDLVTGIHNVRHTQAGISIYPNPANEKTVITSSAPIQSVTIYDISGNPVNTIPAFSSAHELLLGSLASGVYFLRIHSLQGDSFRKLTVMH
jgi:hypothetical protein